MNKVIVVGTGGHAKVVSDIILKSGDELVGYLDGITPYGVFLERPILGNEYDYVNYPDCKFIIAIGDSKVRENIAEMMLGADWYTAIHPSSVVSQIDVKIGRGTVVCANAVINPSTVIGDHCIINTAACIEHDDTIGDFSHISVGAKMAGHVSVGSHVWLGIGATVRDKVKICDHAFVGAGAVVVKDISKQGLYIGVPAKLKNKGKDDENKI